MQYRRKKPVKPVLRNLITVMHLCKFILTKYAVVDELNAHIWKVCLRLILFESNKGYFMRDCSVMCIETAVSEEWLEMYPQSKKKKKGGVNGLSSVGYLVVSFQ